MRSSLKGGDARDTDWETIRNKTLPRLLADYQKYEGDKYWGGIEKSSNMMSG
ncbi:hypothetical protein [Microseira sp. BLCC-F43]|jgi:hypothetical protein|uniref:hypothetical protein n=1 Tax=Microseira sp. BLCC-F43 TaxID=3153602 RepID=UPI0035B79BA3